MGSLSSLLPPVFFLAIVELLRAQVLILKVADELLGIMARTKEWTAEELAELRKRVLTNTDQQRRVRLKAWTELGGRFS